MNAINSEKPFLKRTSVIVTLSALLLVATAGAVYYGFTSNQDDSINNPVSDNIVEDKDQPLTDGTPGTEDKTTIPSGSSSTPPADQPEKPVITRAAQSNDIVRVTVVFSRSSNGSCSLVLKHTSGQIITKEAPITVGPSYYTCDGFRVPRDEFPVSGDWTATVTHTQNDKKTSSDPVTISVQ